MALLTSVFTLICVLRMNEILRRDLALRRVTKVILVLSLLTIPLPIYALVMHMKDQSEHRYANVVINDRSIPIYVEFGLMAFYLLLCGNIFCSIQGAAEERVSRQIFRKFWANIEILVKNRNFGQKSKCWPKIEC